MKAKILQSVFAIVFAWAGVIPAFSQADVSSATIKGTVTDQNKAVVVGAIVTAKSTERGTTRSGKTGSDGSYVIPTLQPGVYEVRVEAQGFDAAVVPKAEVTVGQIAIYDIELQPAGVKAQVEITTDAPVIEAERTQQANTINKLQVENLPNITRDFTQYVFTLPGVSSSTVPRAQNPGFTFGTSGFSIGGSNGRNNLITIDGGENEYGSGQLRYFPSVEAIQEYQVNRNAFAAEFGFTAGTAVNVVTKSGTNDFHGSVYAFYRSQKLAKRQFFNIGTKKAFDQQAYPGFTFGGPIKKNKAFFFTSYEHLKSDAARFRNYLTNPLLNPTAGQATYFNLLAASSNANIRRIGTDLQATLTTTTAGRYPNTLKLLTDSTGNFTAAERFHSWTSRIDYQISDKDSLNGRFSLYRTRQDNLLGGGATTAISTTAFLPTRDYTTVANWTHTFSPNVVNQARVQLVPNNSARTIPKAPGTTSLLIGGVGSFGRDFATPFNTFQDRYQFEDTLSFVKGKHSTKFGASFRTVSYEVINELWFGGEWTFSSGIFPSILAVAPADRAAIAGFNIANGLGQNGPATANLSSLQAFNLNLPFLYRQGFNNPRWKDRANYLGVFGQDSWKIHQRFTLDYGVRFDYDAEPAPLKHKGYVSPRLGFAWDATGDQKTVIRAGGGLFYSPVYYQVAYVTNLLNDSGQFINQIFKTPVSVPATQTPAAIWAAGLAKGLPFKALTEADLNALGVNTGAKNPGRVVFDADPNYKNNYSAQVSFGISRQLMRDLSLDVAWQMYRGVHIQLSHEVNYVEAPCAAGATTPVACLNPAAYGPRYVPIDPTIVQKNIYKSIGNSIYHGLTASLRKRFSNHFQFDANYTFSKAIDDQTDFNSAFSSFLPTRLNQDRAVSAFDVRHNFVANAVILTPFKAGPGHNALARALADINVSPILQMRSAIPFTIRLGTDTNGDTHGVYDRPFKASRNSGRGDRFYSTSLRVNKQFFIKRESGVRVEFITELTNLFNRTNFLSVNDVFGVNTPFLLGPFDIRGTKALKSTSPLGFNSALPPFQAQFGLKFAF